MHWSESAWFKEWIRLARKNYQMYKSDFVYDFKAGDEPNNFGRQTYEVVSSVSKTDGSQGEYGAVPLPSSKVS
jgi:hypothetical protein